jgi:hypothetical protein
VMEVLFNCHGEISIVYLMCKNMNMGFKMLLINYDSPKLIPRGGEHVELFGREMQH